MGVHFWGSGVGMPVRELLLGEGGLECALKFGAVIGEDGGVSEVWEGSGDGQMQLSGMMAAGGLGGISESQMRDGIDGGEDIALDAIALPDDRIEGEALAGLQLKIFWFA